MESKVKIISVGNPLYGDDGIGKAVLEELMQSNSIPSASYYDAATDALSILDEFEFDGLNIIVDAAKMGKNPGTVAHFTSDEARTIIQWDHLSLHGFGLAETFALAKQLDKLPSKVMVIGIEPENIGIQEGISESVLNTIPEVINIIKLEIESYEHRKNDINH